MPGMDHTCLQEQLKHDTKRLLLVHLELLYTETEKENNSKSNCEVLCINTQMEKPNFSL